MFFNAKFNNLWAGGNIYLLANTVYEFVQTWLSIFEVMEIPFYLRYFKAIRYLSLFSAIIYDFFYFGMCFDFIAYLYIYSKEKYEFLDMLQAMFFAYNIILHFPIPILDSMIIGKEI